MATVVSPGARSRSQSKVAFFVIFGLLTVFVTYMKNARVFDPASEIAQHFAPVRWYLLPHAFFGALAMLLGAFQFSNRLRARYLKTHRMLGYVYVVSVFVAAPLAVPMTMRFGPSLVAASECAVFRMDVDDRDRTLLRPPRQCRPAPSLDDSQLSLCHGLYRDAVDYPNSSDSAARSGGNRDRGLDRHCAGCNLAEYSARLACDYCPSDNQGSRRRLIYS